MFDRVTKGELLKSKQDKKKKKKKKKQEKKVISRPIEEMWRQAEYYATYFGWAPRKNPTSAAKNAIKVLCLQRCISLYSKILSHSPPLFLSLSL